MEVVFVSKSKVVMRGQPLPASMDEWTGCREEAYIESPAGQGNKGAQVMGGRTVTIEKV